MRSKKIAAPLLTTAAAAVLVACGGGGGGSSSTPPAAAQVRISGKAVDGALQGAHACYDLNDNNACDANEPSATSAADGSFAFDVDAAAAGKHRLVVEVPATAVDADTGTAVGTAFTLLAPASGTSTAHAVFASPLTTLVQKHVDATGATLADAVELIRSQTNLGVSPLADFTAAANAANQQAATVARLVQLTTMKQGEALAAIVGQLDLSGTPISAQDVQKAVAQALVAALPSVAAEAADPQLAALSGAALQAALATAADNVVAQAGTSAEETKASIGLAKLPPDPASTDAPAATASLTALRWTDANNWYARTLEASAADNTPDADNKVRYYEVHRQSESNGYSPNGTSYGWAFGNARQRAGDLHWNGSAWAGCTLGDRYLSTVRDAAGNSSYDYCDGYEVGTSTRSSVDVAGQSIATVVADKVRTMPGGASGVAYAQWGPANLSAFGSATFPAGARLLYQSNTITKTAVSYDTQASNVVFAQVLAVAQGGDVRSSAALACGAATLPAATEVTTLDDLIARNPAKPCIFNRGVQGSDSSLDPNEWWSNSTVSLGSLANDMALPAGTGNWYTTERRLRVGFTGTNQTTYYSCLTRSGNLSSRNCSVIGTGSYTITTLGDARVMSFTNLPSITQRTGFTRVFVERGGKVWYGYRNVSGTTTPYLRMNLAATNAVFAALPGLPPVRPVTRAADMSTASRAVLATMKGVWGGTGLDGALFFRFGDDGRFLMGNASAPNIQTREQTGSELGWFEVDAATGQFRTLIEVDSNLTAGTSHPLPEEISDRLTVSATQIQVNGQDFLPRLAQTSGLVGLWALNSATELKTQHFAFFANGKVLLADPLGDTGNGACTAANQGPPGAEFASYTYDAASGALRVFAKEYDTNGCAGFFDSSAGAAVQNTEANFVVVIAPDGKTATVTSAGEPTRTVYRIASQ